MKTLAKTLGMIAGLGLAHAAVAADLPSTKAPPLVSYVSAYNWTGLYAGANAGYGWGGNTGGTYSSFVDPAVTGIGGVGGTFFAGGGNVLPSVKPKGFVGGGQIGYNMQVAPNWIFGFAADIQDSGMKASGVGVAPTVGLFSGITEAKTAKIDWFGTVRGKIGYAFNNSLLYATGGLAYGKVGVSTSFRDPTFAGATLLVFNGSRSSTKTGWALGAGYEYGLTRNWTIGAEYLYVSLGSVSVTETQTVGPATGNTFTSSSKYNANIARAFLNYKFQ